MQIVIYHLTGSETGRRDVFPSKRLVLGRDESCDVRFDLQRDREVSGRHLELAPRGEKLELIDLDSTNGSWVNGQEMKRSFIDSGDEVELGSGGPKIRIVIRYGFWKDLGGAFGRLFRRS